MRKLVLLFPFFLLYQNLFAQLPNKKDSYDPPKNLLETVSFLNKDSLVFYYNYRYEIVKAECAEIFRFTKLDSTTAKFTGKFIDFFYDSTIIAEGNYINGVKDGLFKIYYLNGKIKESGFYKNGIRIGIWEYWYENGSIKQKINFSDETSKVIDFWDEKGKKRVNNGEGYYSVNKRVNNGESNYSVNFSQLIYGSSTLEGKIVNGNQDGKWKLFVSESASYIEVYKDGKFVEGKHIFLLGTEEYTDKTHCDYLDKELIDNSEKFIVGKCLFHNNYGLSKIISPEFKGGEEGFRLYVARKLQYPEEAANLGVQGRVILQFTIEPDGTVANIVVIHSDSSLLNNEAIRVIKSSPKWKPGTQNGKPIRTSYTFPVTFILQ